MHRRALLAALGAGSLASFEVSTPMPRDTHTPTDRPLEPLTLASRDRAWIDRTLQDHYGAAWRQPPTRGIFHHRTDNEWHLPTSRTAILQRAGVFVDVPQPEWGEEAYDCEDYAMHLYSALTMAHPQLSVGIAFNYAGDHVFTVFVTADGDVIEYEPQTGEVVTDSDDAYYQFEEGLLVL